MVRVAKDTDLRRPRVQGAGTPGQINPAVANEIGRAGAAFNRAFNQIGAALGTLGQEQQAINDAQIISDADISLMKSQSEASLFAQDNLLEDGSGFDTAALDFGSQSEKVVSEVAPKISDAKKRQAFIDRTSRRAVDFGINMAEQKRTHLLKGALGQLQVSEQDALNLIETQPNNINEIIGSVHERHQQLEGRAFTATERELRSRDFTGKAVGRLASTLAKRDPAAFAKLVDQVQSLQTGGQPNVPVKNIIKQNTQGKGERQGAIQGIVVHHTAGSNLSGAITHGNQTGTGTHYYIDRDGTVHQFADDNTRMVHMRNHGDRFRTDKGKFAHLGNDTTIGIEVVAKNARDINAKQSRALNQLLGQLSSRHNIKKDNVLGHGELQGGPGGNKQRDEGVAGAKQFREQGVIAGKRRKPIPKEIVIDSQVGTIKLPSDVLTRMPIDQLQRLQKSQRASLKGVADANIRDMQTRLKNGQPLSQQKLKTVGSMVGFVGDSRLVRSFAELSMKSRIAEQYRGRSLPGIEADVNRVVELVGEQDVPHGNLELKLKRDYLKDVRKQTEEDLLGFAAAQGQVDLQDGPINFQEFSQWLKNRKDNAERAAAIYRVKPQFFRPGEKQQLSQALDKAGVDQKLFFIQNINSVFGSQTPNVLKEIGSIDAKFAHVAGLALNGSSHQGLARMALKGFDLLKADRGKNTLQLSKSNIGRIFQEEIGGALGDEAPTFRANAMETAQALLASRSAQSGEPPEEDDIRRAVQESVGALFDRNGTRISGGLTDLNGGKVLLPPRLTEEQFEDVVERFEFSLQHVAQIREGRPKGAVGIDGDPRTPSFEAEIERVDVLTKLSKFGGRPINLDTGRNLSVDDWQNIRFFAVGDGEYRLAIGNPFKGGVWVVDSNGSTTRNGQTLNQIFVLKLMEQDRFTADDLLDQAEVPRSNKRNFQQMILNEPPSSDDVFSIR